jgi:hypothetical protein
MLRILMTDDNHRDTSPGNFTPRELWYRKIDVSWRERVVRQLSVHIVDSGVQQLGNSNYGQAVIEVVCPASDFFRS